jgi:plasmid replication initiation protein
MADLPPPDPPSPIVTMSNALTRAAHGLSLAEKRIVMSAVAKLDPRRGHPAGTVLVTQVTAAEYAETFGLDPTTAYEQLKNGGKELYQRSITFFREAYNRRGKPIAPTRVTMRWIGRAQYHDGEGWIEVAWWPDVVPHLTGLRKQFTQLQLKQASALRSIYSWKLLELLMRFNGTGWAEYDIEDFAEAMEATEKQRADFNNLRRRMIEPAVKELQEKDGWIIDWKPILGGRRVKAVRFDFRRDDQLRLDLGKHPTKPRPQPRPVALDAPALPAAPEPKRRREPDEAELQAFAHPGESREETLARWRARGPAAALAALRR